jgi:hypothetical protein
MYPVGLKSTISAGERAQSYALDRAATGTGIAFLPYFIILCAWHDGDRNRSKHVAVSEGKVAVFDGMLQHLNI